MRVELTQNATMKSRFYVEMLTITYPALPENVLSNRAHSINSFSINFCELAGGIFKFVLNLANIIRPPAFINELFDLLVYLI